VGEHRDFKRRMTLERDLRHTVTNDAISLAMRRGTMRLKPNLRHQITDQALGRVMRGYIYGTRIEPRGAIAGWLGEFWEFLCGR
jgi:hypothetical protein